MPNHESTYHSASFCSSNYGLCKKMFLKFWTDKNWWRSRNTETGTVQAARTHLCPTPGRDSKDQCRKKWFIHDNQKLYSWKNGKKTSPWKSYDIYVIPLMANQNHQVTSSPKKTEWLRYYHPGVPRLGVSKVPKLGVHASWLIYSFGLDWISGSRWYSQVSR